MNFVFKRSNPGIIGIAFLLALSPSARTPAQTLARPGWAGSGMTAQSWFRHAVLYHLDTRTFARSSQAAEDTPGTLKGLTERLDYIHDLGIDAILLEPLQSADSAQPTQPIDSALGTLDDFDNLALQASRHNLRILLTLPNADPASARFWLTRGVAGFYVPGPSTTPSIQAIRKLLPGFAGQRILITDVDLAQTTATGKSPANELQLDSTLVKLPGPDPANLTAQLRAGLEQTHTLLRTGNPALATDAASAPSSVTRFAPPGQQAASARLLAAVLLLTRAVPVLYAGQELGAALPDGHAAMIPWGKSPAPAVEPEPEATAKAPPAAPATSSASDHYVPYVPLAKPVAPVKPAPPDPASAAGQELDPTSLLNFYRQLIQLHHGKATLRDGDEIVLNHDDLHALLWVRGPAHPSPLTPAVVVLCNPSSSPLRLSLKSELSALRLRGSFLRTLLRSGSESLTMNLDAVSLPPFGVYIGELRY